ncbi:MAG: hypothetical protein ACK4VO_12170 [Pseudobdellovibrio sp.]
MRRLSKKPQSKFAEEHFLQDYIGSKLNVMSLNQLATCYLDGNTEKLISSKQIVNIRCSIDKIEAELQKITKNISFDNDEDLNLLKELTNKIKEKYNQRVETKSIFLNICIKLFERIPSDKEIKLSNLINYLSEQVKLLFDEVKSNHDFSLSKIKATVSKAIENHPSRFDIKKNKQSSDLQNAIVKVKSRLPLPKGKT